MFLVCVVFTILVFWMSRHRFTTPPQLSAQSLSAHADTVRLGWTT